jgi:hypothetical protein
MSAAKTVVASFLALLLLSCPPRVSRNSQARSGGPEVGVAACAITPSALSPSGHMPRSTSVTRFAPWRNRIKIVLEETNHEIPEECDFGPAVLPTQNSNSTSIELIDHRPPASRCLRC